MKKIMIGLLGTAAMLVVVPETMAKDHHHNEGLHLAAGIVNLVKAVIAPTPVVVTPPPPQRYRPAPPPARPHGRGHGGHRR